jgi:COP9 signalosome complex subunit 2
MQHVFGVCSTVKGRIDQVNQVLKLEKESSGSSRYAAMDKWSQQLASLHQSIVNKMA